MQVCAYKLGIPLENVVTMPTDTVATANSMTTGASVTSEIICHVSNKFYCLIYTVKNKGGNFHCNHIYTDKSDIYIKRCDMTLA